MAATHQLMVENTSAKGIRTAHIADGELKPYASMRVATDVEVPTAYRSISYVTCPDVEDNTSFHWHQKHLLPFNTAPDDSNLYIDIINGNGSLIGSARLAFSDLFKDVRIGSDPTRRMLPLLLPGDVRNGSLEFDVSVGPLPANPDAEGHPPENEAIEYA